MKKKKLELSLEDACEVVEKYARSIGQDCEIIFTDNRVQVALLSWSGDVTAPSLFEALTDAIQLENS